MERNKQNNREKAAKLLWAMEDISDQYIEETAPKSGSAGKRTIRTQVRMRRIISVAACFLLLFLTTTAFAANYVENSISEFYLRYLDPQDMAVADAMAGEYGPKVYFDGLKSDDMYKQYVSINKLVEYYNDEKTKAKAIDAITPFLTNKEAKVSDAATFALSVLKDKFDDPRLVQMADGSVVFTLFNDYSDYGSQNKIWRIKDGKMESYYELPEPHMYIRWIIPSPDAKRLAIVTSSSSSEYLWIDDREENLISKELIGSARSLVAQDMGYALWQDIDFENYSGIMTKLALDEQGVERYVDNRENIQWLDNDTIMFKADLRGDMQKSGEAKEFSAAAIVRYNFQTKQMGYELISWEE